MPVNKKATTDAVEILHRKFYAGHPEKLKALAECRANDEIARKIRMLRTKVPTAPNRGRAEPARSSSRRMRQLCKRCLHDSPAVVQASSRA